MISSPTLFLFDLDGTLLQCYYSDDQSYFRAFMRLMDLNEIPKLNHTDPHLTDSFYFNALFKHLENRPPNDSEVKEMHRLFKEELHTNAANQPHHYHEIPGASSFITHLETSPHSVGVASGGWRQMMEFKLSKIDVLSKVDGYIGSDDHEDKADFTRALIEQMDPSGKMNAIYFGDSHYDHNRMSSLDIPFVGVDFKRQGLFEEFKVPVITDFTDHSNIWNAVDHYFPQPSF